MQTIFLALLLAQPPVPQIPDDTPTVTIKEIRKENLANRPEIPDNYASARNEAIANAVPLVLFINQDARQIAGFVTVRTGTRQVDGEPVPFGIIVARARGNDLVWAATLNPNASDTAIREAVKPAASPFRPGSILEFLRHRREQQRTADANIETEGSPWLNDREQQRIRAMWPKDLDFPEGMKFYKRTDWTQYMANNNGQDMVMPYPVDKDHPFSNSAPAENPNSHKKEWRTPGGLADVPFDSWQSYVGASIAGKPGLWKSRMQVETAPNGSLPKMLGEYPSGTVFADLLVNASGKPFEVRMRDKTEDRTWDSHIAFKDTDARPDGYTSFKQSGKKSCAECHEQADFGDGSLYFINLRGFDGVRSFPLLREGALEANPFIKTKVWQ